MAFPLHRWLKISLLNFFIIACIGVILRYKIIFSLSFVDQKHLLHGHSHFAFSGWITQALMALLVAYLARKNPSVTVKKYNRLLSLNLVSAYGMLIAFPIQGYGLYSISFSTFSIIVSVIFTITYWKDLNRLSERSVCHRWFKAGLFFNVLSSAGAFALAGMMVAQTVHQNWYLAAIYFFLHFQYNGWFFFACMGLLCEKLCLYINEHHNLNRIYLFFVFACLPAYFLSTLWMKIPLVIYILVIIAALGQVLAWVWLIQIVKRHWRSLEPEMPVLAKWLLGFSGLAITIKLLLQTGSVIPALGTLAFGFRPIVIGYLHLVLLGGISLFILGYLFANHLLHISKLASAGVFVFTVGIMVNEILLMIQGITAMSYISIPYINEMLFSAALILFTGMLLLNLSQVNKEA